ncbi:MAG: arsenite methyltransferase [Syntrophales bacterium]|nr:arsenite methyltransferase [Syntrophales bacterium]
MKHNNKKIKSIVREKYSRVAISSESGCSKECCSGLLNPAEIASYGETLGYEKDRIAMELNKANLGLGCGNPLAIADLKEGEVVLDLGSGAGFDVFLAAKSVGGKGYVIGVDMTSEMVAIARKNAEELKVSNCEFRLGEIENLPVDDDFVDVVVSNCVINLSPDKRAVYREILRVLRPGGRISISDVLRSGEIPREIKDDPSAYTG